MAPPRSVPRPDWEPLTIEAAAGIDSENAGFPAHSAPFGVDVVCLDGAGFVPVGEETFPFRAGRSVRWPSNAMHRLWTEADEMTNLMVEHGSWDAPRPEVVERDVGSAKARPLD